MATLNKGRRSTPVEEYTIRSEPLRLTTNSQRVSSKTPHLKPQRVSFLENRSASRLKPPCFRETETSSPRSDRNVFGRRRGAQAVVCFQVSLLWFKTRLTQSGSVSE